MAVDGNAETSQTNQLPDSASSALLGELKRRYRPRTSCDQCRHRKIKCDRVQPCLSCCQAGRPRECHFPGQAGDHAVPQSQEIKALRKANQNLRRQVADLEEQLRRRGDDSGTGNGTTLVNGAPCSMSQRETVSLPPTSSSDAVLAAGMSSMDVNVKIEKVPDSLFFGCPGLAEVAHELSSSRSSDPNLQPLSLAYLFPRGFDAAAYEDAPAYPFPSLWPSKEGTAPLLRILPPTPEIFLLLKSYEENRTCCLFPYVPREMGREQLNTFLSGLPANADRNPQLLALLFSTLAISALINGFAQAERNLSADEMGMEKQNADVFVAAAMQALGLSSFMNRPTLMAIKALLMIGAYLITAGNFLNAYTLYGATIRLAQCIGLHRNPELLETVPPPDECNHRRVLWWYMLWMDVKYSITLGRPLGISGIGDCSPAVPFNASQSGTRFIIFINQFTVLSRQILASESITNEKIDKFTDDILLLFDTLPAPIRFDESWLSREEPPDGPLGVQAVLLFSETHNHIVLLNRQRKSDTKDKGNAATIHTTGNPDSLRGYSRVIASCRAILDAFIFCHKHVQPILGAWTLCQKAFNAAMIIALHMRDTMDPSELDIVIKAQEIFFELQRDKALRLAGLASERLRMLTNPWLDDVTPPAWLDKESVMGGTGMMLLDDHGLHGHIAGDP